MIVLIGASGSGKSSIERMLIEKYNYNKIVPYTTRQPRENEVNGVDYNFITERTFLTMAKCNLFLNPSKYGKWYYGSLTASYEKENSDNAIAILTPHEFREIKKTGDRNDIVSFYIDVDRKSRLIKIIERGDDIEEAYRRNLTDVGLFDGIEDEVDFIINNNAFHKTIEHTAILINSIYKNYLDNNK